MVLILGAIFGAAGALIAALTWPEFWPVLRGVIALSLLFWGAILALVGFSQRRAHRLYRDATREEDTSVVTPSNTP